MRNKGHVVISWGIIALLVILTGCSAKKTVPPPMPVTNATSTVPAASPATPTPLPPEAVDAFAARVNGTTISMAEYTKEVAEWEAAFVAQNPNLSDQDRQSMLNQGRRQVLDVMIEQVIIEQDAAKQGIVVSDQDIDDAIRRSIEENGGQERFESWLKTNNWTEDEFKSRQRSMMIAGKMFEHITHDVPTKAEQVHARHILVATDAEAQTLLGQLKNGADFAQLAAQYSLDPSTKDSGGDLGFFPRDTLIVPEVEEAAFALEVGQVSEIISSAMGFHIVQVLERIQDMVLTEESWQALKEATFRRWLSELWADAEIEVQVTF